VSYLISRGEQEYGPYSLEDLKRYVAQGLVQLNDYAWTDGMAAWMTVSSLLASLSETVPRVESEHAPSATVRTNRAIGGLPEATPGLVVRSKAPVRPDRVPVEAPAEPVRRESGAEAGLHTGNALTWPFHQHKWFESLWIPLLWWFPLPPLCIGTLAGLGWMLDAIERRGLAAPARLPRGRDVGKMFKEGLVYLGAFIVYFSIPLAVIAFLVAVNKERNIDAFNAWADQGAGWCWDTAKSWIGGPPAESFASIRGRFGEFLLHEQAWALFFKVLAPLYTVLTIPVFAAGAIRFALTRKAKTFFNPAANFLLVIEHLGGFLWFLLLYYGIQALILLVVAIFSETYVVPVMLVIPILLGALDFWMVAYVAGSLAAKIWKRDARVRRLAGVEVAEGAS
jgi:GYF domain 2/Protein of unknown function (DUF4013)